MCGYSCTLAKYALVMCSYQHLQHEVYALSRMCAVLIARDAQVAAVSEALLQSAWVFTCPYHRLYNYISHLGCHLYSHASFLYGFCVPPSYKHFPVYICNWTIYCGVWYSWQYSGRAWMLSAFGMYRSVYSDIREV